MGQVVYELPFGPAVMGMTSLGDETFVLRHKRDYTHIEVCDVSYRLLRHLNVSYIRACNDMTSCEHYHRVYISDPDVMCIHKVDVDGVATKKWPVNGIPCGLSVNKAHNVLVTCCVVRKIKEFSSHGVLLRQMTLPDDVINPCHAIQLTTGQYVVCHGDRGNPVHRVCKMSTDCSHIVHSQGGQPGSDNGQYNIPQCLAV